eukprot:761449-Hanusia_phi.AAC.1
MGERRRRREELDEGRGGGRRLKSSQGTGSSMDEGRAGCDSCRWMGREAKLGKRRAAGLGQPNEMEGNCEHE